MVKRTKIKFISHFTIPLLISLSFAMPLEAKETNRGFPDPKSVPQVQDEQDLQQAIMAYRFWYPTVSSEAIFNGNRELGAKDNEDILILSAQPHHVVFTANSDTPYGSGVVDLTKGPIVVEIPPGPYIALANDHHQRWIVDMGIPGADKGQGGKYLILPPGYKEKAPTDGYRVAQSDSFKTLIAIRVLPVKGDIDAALNNLRNIKIYPLSTASNPKLLKYIDGNQSKLDSTPLRWETNLAFWEKLHHAIETEPVVAEFRPMYGLLAKLGIEKGKPFKPDERMKNILEQAAKTANAQMFVAGFASARPERMAWSDRKWEWIGLTPDNADFETPHALDMDARDRWFIQAIGTSPAMFRRVPGEGSLYWLGLRDKEGTYLEGGNTYKLRVPLPVPAKLFWSLTVYDVATRSEIQTNQNKAALRSLFELSNTQNLDHIDLYFGPNAPAGKEAFWIKTIPGKNWFSYFRIYGPEKAAFNDSWKPGDFEKI